MAKEESSLTAMRLVESQSGQIAAVLLSLGLGRQHPLTPVPGRRATGGAKKATEASVAFGMA
jgi:hypothetical protein